MQSLSACAREPRWGSVSAVSTGAPRVVRPPPGELVRTWGRYQPRGSPPRVSAVSCCENRPALSLLDVHTPLMCCESLSLPAYGHQASLTMSCGCWATSCGPLVCAGVGDLLGCLPETAWAISDSQKEKCCGDFGFHTPQTTQLAVESTLDASVTKLYQPRSNSIIS